MLNKECQKGLHTLIDVDFYQIQFVPPKTFRNRCLCLEVPSLVIFVYFQYSEEAVETLKSHGYNRTKNSLNVNSLGGVRLPLNFLFESDEYMNPPEYFQEIIKNLTSIFTDSLQAVLFSKHQDERYSKLSELILTCFKTENAKYIEI